MWCMVGEERSEVKTDSKYLLDMYIRTILAAAHTSCSCIGGVFLVGLLNYLFDAQTTASTLFDFGVCICK